jgi:hypothetical protein
LSPLRSDGSRNGQAGEAGPEEQCSAEAKSLKTKGQGTVWLPPQWATTEAARRGASGPDKRTTLTITYLKKQAMGKSNWSRKKLQVYEKKGKTLTLCSNLELAVGDDFHRCR